MRRIKEKLAFGVFQDGLIIKVAQLVYSNNIVKVQSLDETILSSPLFHKEEIKKGKFEQLDEDLHLPEITDTEDDAFNLPEISEFEPTESIGTPKKDEILPGQRDLQNFLQIFPLDKGKISFNANDEQISYFQFNSSYSTSKLLKKLQNEMLSEEEIIAKNFSLDYILNPDKSGLAFVHRGKFTLFHALRDINLVLSKEKFFYSYIDTNEIALMNLVKHNYDFPLDEYVLILYVGVDYKVGIVMKNKIHIKTFPIIVPDTDPENMRQAIYSKVILEQDISDIPITKHILLVGDYANEDDVEFFHSKGLNKETVQRLNLKHLHIQDGMEGQITDEKIARFAIPIALAWKTLEPKCKDFSPCNLLPVQVIENQKYFKIAWHGFIILAAIFYFAFNGTINNLEVKQETETYIKKNNDVERELTINRELINKLNEIKDKISRLEANLEKVRHLTGKRNQWHYMLSVLSTSLQNNWLSWINDISSTNDNFTISGYSTSRRSIIKFSELFPQGHISSITKDELEDMNVWEYNLSYSYPDPQERKKKKIIKEITPKEETPAPKPVKQIKTVSNETIVKEYKEILDLYFVGDYETALKSFNDFIQKYPQHNLSYNANYFAGECLYQTSQIEKAIQIFEIIYNFKQSKSPDALIMLGNCYQKKRDFETATAYWNKLIKEYPSNVLVKSAKYKIQQLKEI
ncbi:MAG: tetratricopeptide repeat protein [Candidatus Cloacimonetes bacterium]|nr:tetratricopeptide repeat protein [Candidatus Cloacimonadota bacterium]